MPKNTLRTILLYFSLAIISCTQRTVHQWEDRIRKRPNFEMYLVEKVLSGDRIRLSDGKIVKYSGIRAPARGEFFFAKSRDANVWLLRRGKVFLRFSTPEKDAKGRYLAYAYSPVGGGLYCFLNRELVYHGYAVVANDKLHKKAFLRLQKLAKEAKRGLWMLK